MGWPLRREQQLYFQDWALFGDLRSWGPHEGLDLHVVTGDDVLACRDGIVAVVLDKGDVGYGKRVVIKHEDGWTTWYGHLSEFFCEPGEQVVRGQKIGEAGNTGNSTGPHLHLTVQHHGFGQSGYVLPDVVDPLPLLQGD